MKNFFRMWTLVVLNIFMAQNSWAGQGSSTASASLGPEVHMQNAATELELAVANAKKTIAKKIAICKFWAQIMKQPIDVGDTEEFPSVELQSFLPFSDLRSIDALAEELKPALNELYQTYPPELIIEKMAQVLAEHRLQLNKLNEALFYSQSFIRTKDRSDLQKSISLLKSIINDSTPNAFSPIGTKVREILEKYQYHQESRSLPL